MYAVYHVPGLLQPAFPDYGHSQFALNGSLDSCWQFVKDSFEFKSRPPARSKQRNDARRRQSHVSTVTARLHCLPAQAYQMRQHVALLRPLRSRGSRMHLYTLPAWTELPPSQNASCAGMCPTNRRLRNYASLEPVAFPECAQLKLWLQVRNVGRFSSYKGISQHY